MAELATYLGVGAVVGFFAGLLGIGGGIIIVSSLALMFAAHAFAPAHVMHLAIGTSLAAIVFGSFASFRAHHRHGAVDWSIVLRLIRGTMVKIIPMDRDPLTLGQVGSIRRWERSGNARRAGRARRRR